MFCTTNPFVEIRVTCFVLKHYYALEDMYTISFKYYIIFFIFIKKEFYI